MGCEVPWGDQVTGAVAIKPGVFGPSDLTVVDMSSAGPVEPADVDSILLCNHQPRAQLNRMQ